MAKRLALLLSLFVVVALVPGAGGAAPANPCGVKGGTLKYVWLRDALGLDPHLNYGATSSSLQGNLYDPLVDYDVRGRIGPALAESWTNPNPTTYIFKLRRNVVFHDGAPFTADDVVYTFQRVQDPANRATRQRYMDNTVESVRAVDPFTVEIKLKTPAATFLDVLAGREMYIVNRRWGSNPSNDFKKAANGTGPYRLANYEPNVRYVLERHQKAWHNICLDRIEFQPIVDDRARVNALKSGQADFAEYLPWQDTEALIKERGFRVYRGFEIFNFVRINPNRAPTNDPRVRQALNFAINRLTVSLLAFGGQAQPMDGFLMRKDSWAYDPATSRPWKFDRDRALALLREAGYANPANLRILFESSNLGVHIDTAQVIAGQLRQLGITVDFRVTDFATVLQKRTSGDYQLMMDGLSLPYGDPDAYYDFFHSSGTAYAVGPKFKNDRLDQLLDEGRRTVGRDKRKPIYTEIEKILFAEAPWIFGLWRPQAEGAHSYVKGYVRMPGGLGTHTVAYLERLWIEK